MNTKDSLNEFKAIADKMVKNIKEEWTDVKSKWAPDEEESSRRFEELKLKFRGTLDTLKQNINTWKEENQDEINSLNQKIDEMQVQLSLGKAEGLDAFEEQKKKISLQWNLLKLKLEQHPRYHTLQQELKEEILNWRIKMDLLKIQFALGKVEVKDRWENISGEISKEVEHLGKVVEAGAGIAGEKLDQFEVEIKKIFEKFKK